MDIFLSSIAVVRVFRPSFVLFFFLKKKLRLMILNMKQLSCRSVLIKSARALSSVILLATLLYLTLCLCNVHSHQWFCELLCGQL